MSELTLRFNGTIVVSDDSGMDLETAIEVVSNDLRDLINGELPAENIPYLITVTDVEVTP